MNLVQQQPFLRVPPFPGARPTAFAVQGGVHEHLEDARIDELLDLVRTLKVGGDYWEKQPPLPKEPYVLVRIAEPSARSGVFEGLPTVERMVCWTDSPMRDDRFHKISGPCDPWHLLGGANRAIVEPEDELALVAAIAGVPVTCTGNGARPASADNPAAALRAIFRERVVDTFSYRNPFTGEPMSPDAAIRLCGFWRQLVDSNRDIATAIGFAFWKQPTVAPLLWSGSDVNFVTKVNDKEGIGGVAVWKARTPAPVLTKLEEREGKLIEVEDGFIRSTGLGADCVPPLSIVVDRLGAHFDPGNPSELEQLVQDGAFSVELVERARKLRELIVASGVSKYGAGSASLGSRVRDRRYVLVPGQVEDDRAVTCGGGVVQDNFDLLRRVRAAAPDAYILYKPHPDVEAGHRVGAIAEERCLEIANEIVRDQPISALIELVDEVHVNTSLAGFEALLRLKPVTTHGVPFYAGWGLTNDLGPVPGRRTATRTLDELVAAVLLLYPRYLDPVTGLPCPPEILVRRIAEGIASSHDGVVVRMRRLQGRWKKRLAVLGLRR